MNVPLFNKSSQLLEITHFVLNPKTNDVYYAFTSTDAMLRYADSIADEDEYLATVLRDFADRTLEAERGWETGRQLLDCFIYVHDKYERGTSSDSEKTDAKQ